MVEKLKTQKHQMFKPTNLTLFQTYSIVSNNEWTLIARFSNDDSKQWITDGSFWYDRDSPYGDANNPASNTDMISAAFWELKGSEIKITRSDDSSHTALLQTTSNCLQGRLIGILALSGSVFELTQWIIIAGIK